MDVGELGGLIGLLLSRGADPNFSTIPLQPMFYAVLVGEVEITKKLLDSGARADDCLPDEVCVYSGMDSLYSRIMCVCLKWNLCIVREVSTCVSSVL